MSCSHCEARVVNALKNIDGVVDAKASAKDELVKVYYELDINIEEIKLAIEDTGYEVK